MKNVLKKSGKRIIPAMAMLFTFILLKCVFLIGYVPTESMEQLYHRLPDIFQSGDRRYYHI